MSEKLASSNGIAFLLAVDIVYTVVAAACSSPQTTEINAGARSATLMKWVGIGLLQAIVIVGIAAAIDPPNRRAAYLGGGIGGAVAMWLQYAHANKSGLASSAPGTEDYGRPTAGGGIAAYYRRPVPTPAGG